MIQTSRGDLCTSMMMMIDMLRAFLTASASSSIDNKSYSMQSLMRKHKSRSHSESLC